MAVYEINLEPTVARALDVYGVRQTPPQSTRRHVSAINSTQSRTARNDARDICPSHHRQRQSADGGGGG